MKVKEEPRPIGRPSQYDKEDVVRAVYKLCKGHYVKARDFPTYLYKLCQKWCGSVRAAKWEAKIIHGRSWNYHNFIKWVYQFAKDEYKEDSEWPENMRALAKRFCGSIRKAKWEAGIIRDCRINERTRRKLDGLWTKKRFMKEFHELCRYNYFKPSQIPGYMRAFAIQHYGSIRAAKWECGILKDVRKNHRR